MSTNRTATLGQPHPAAYADVTGEHSVQRLFGRAAGFVAAQRAGQRARTVGKGWVTCPTT